MEDKILLKRQMKRAWTEMLTLGDHLGDYPQHQKEVYGAALMLEDWMEEIQGEINP